MAVFCCAFSNGPVPKANKQSYRFPFVRNVLQGNLLAAELLLQIPRTRRVVFLAKGANG
jgi:hypothetical protein